MKSKKTSTLSDTYSKQSKQQCLFVTLRELGIDESSSYGLGTTKNYNSLFVQLTTFTPTTQSHLGTKFDDYPKLNNRVLDVFLKQIFSGLGLKNVYLYETFDVKSRSKTNLLPTVLGDTGLMMCLRCVNGVKNSLFMATRNAIAHGNIVQQNGYYILYSVADDKAEYDSPVTFFLRIKSIKRMEAYMKVLALYK